MVNVEVVVKSTVFSVMVPVGIRIIQIRKTAHIAAVQAVKLVWDVEAVAKSMTMMTMMMTNNCLIHQNFTN